MNRSLWELLCEKKSYEELVSIFSPHYERFFPIEVRHYLADWLEHQICSSPFPEDPEFFEYAIHFQNNLIEKVENLAESINENESVENAAKKFRYHETSGKLRYFTADELLHDLCSIMERERYLFTNNHVSISSNHNSFDEEVKRLELKAMQIENKMNQLTNVFQNFQCELLEIQSSSDNNLNHIDYKVQQIALDIRSDYMKKHLLDARDELHNYFNHFIEMSQNIVDEVISVHIQEWKEHQKMFSGSALIDLQNIQLWCEKISDSLHKVYEIISNANDLQQKLYNFDSHYLENPNILQSCDVIQQIFFKLIVNSLVIEEQPSQIIKIGNKIRTSIRLLVGSKFYDKSHIPKVEAYLVSELRAREVLEVGKINGKGSGELIHCSANMATNKSKHFCANFRNMQLKSIERSTKRDVTDEKFAICFSTILKFHNFEVPITIISFPIIVIVHCNQEVRALATIIWDLFFSKITRIPFEVPPEVFWNLFAEAFSKMFKEEVGKELNDENLQFIAEKFYEREVSKSSTNFDNETVTWNDFCKKKISGKDYTFWEWIYSVLKLIKEGLDGYWRNGYIEGFISKASIEKKLKNEPQGTFILRFSDSLKGSISIAYVASKSYGKTSIMHVQPFNLKDLSLISLTDRLNSFNELKILYPNHEKKQIFKIEENKFQYLRDRNGYIVPLQTSRLPSYYEVNRKISMNEKN